MSLKWKGLLSFAVIIIIAASSAFNVVRIGAIGEQLERQNDLFLPLVIVGSTLK